MPGIRPWALFCVPFSWRSTARKTIWKIKRPSAASSALQVAAPLRRAQGENESTSSLFAHRTYMFSAAAVFLSLAWIWPPGGWLRYRPHTRLCYQVGRGTKSRRNVSHADVFRRLTAFPSTETDSRVLQPTASKHSRDDACTPSSLLNNYLTIRLFNWL